MGLRINIQTDPMLRLRPDIVDPGVTPATPPANQPATEPGNRGNITTFPLDGAATEVPRVSLATARADEPNALAGATQQPTALEQTNAQTDRTGVLDGTPAPRVRDFRFLQAAQSARERELESQHSRLEKRLESTNKRLQSEDSVTARIDAQLRRARLEADLDMISSQIRRFRIERIFATSTTPSPAIEQTQAATHTDPSADMAATGAQSSESRTSTLNLIA